MREVKNALLSVIILNYNSAADCGTCIECIKQQDYEAIEIIVVDNASNTDDREKLQYICEVQDVTLVLNDINSGFSAGNNIGLRRAWKKGAKYALIVNPDVQLRSKNYLSHLVSIMEKDSSIVVAAGDMLGLSGDHQNPGKVISYWQEVLWPLYVLKRKFFKQNNENTTWQNEGYCEKLCGGCLFFRMDFMKLINFLDEGTFLYMEETILREQVLQNGFHMYYSPKIEVLHSHKKLAGKVSLKQMEQLWKSQDYYLKKYKPYIGVKKALLKLSWETFRALTRLKLSRSNQ